MAQQGIVVLGNRGICFRLYRRIVLDLVNAELVAASLKWCLEEFVHDGCCLAVCNETSREHQTVGVVVLTDEMGYLRVPSQAGSDAVVLVECDGHSLA